jgi:hypothetical protein
LRDLARTHELYGTLLAPVEALVKDKPSLLVVASIARGFRTRYRNCPTPPTNSTRLPKT